MERRRRTWTNSDDRRTDTLDALREASRGAHWRGYHWTDWRNDSMAALRGREERGTSERLYLD